MGTNENGRITLSWAQLVWGITVLVVLVGGYKDLKTGLANVQTTVNGMYTKAEVDRLQAETRARIDMLERRRAQRVP